MRNTKPSPSHGVQQTTLLRQSLWIQVVNTITSLTLSIVVVVLVVNMRDGQDMMRDMRELGLSARTVFTRVVEEGSRQFEDFEKRYPQGYRDVLADQALEFWQESWKTASQLRNATEKLAPRVHSLIDETQELASHAMSVFQDSAPRVSTILERFDTLANDQRVEDVILQAREVLDTLTGALAASDASEILGRLRIGLAQLDESDLINKLAQLAHDTSSIEQRLQESNIRIEF